MKAQSDLFSNLKFCSQGAGWVVILLGCVGLAGWAVEIEPFNSVLRGLPTMVPNTAISFVLAGLSLWLQRDETAGTARIRTGQVCALGVVLLAALTLGEYLFSWEAGIDQWLFREPLSKLETPISGRPDFLTALNFFLFGLVLLVLDLGGRFDNRPVEILSVTAILISFLALIGYACNEPSFYGWESFFPAAGMALRTSMAFTVLGAGLLCARPDRGLMRILTSPTASGVMSRRLLLAPVLIPLMTGLLKMVGLRLGVYNAELVSWLFSFFNIFIFTIAIWWSAGLLYRAEVVRLNAEADVHKLNAELEGRVTERTAAVSKALTALQESEERGRLILDTALDAVATIDSRGVVTDWNREAEKTFGWSRQKIIGQGLSSAIIPARHWDAPEGGLKQFLATREGPMLSKRIEIMALHRDGREFPVELAITPLRLGDRLIFSAFIRDITERKRAEEAVARESQLLRTVIDHLPDYIYVKDIETRYLLVNSASLRLMNLDRVEETLGKTVFDFFPPDQARAFVEDDRRVMASVQPVLDREELITGQGGETRCLLTTKLPLHDPSGQVTGLVGISRDITERKQVEERLRQSEANLAAAQKLAHLGSWEMRLTNLEDMKRNPLHWSDEVFRIFGYEPGQIGISRENFLRMVHPDDRLQISEAIPALLNERRPYNLVHRISLPDGVVRVVHEIAEIVYDEGTGRPVKVVGTVQDITERKRVEAQLERSRAELQLILDTVPALIFFKDLQHRHGRVNLALLRFLGVSNEAIEGRTDKDMGSPHADRYYHDEDEVISSGQPKRGIIEPVVTPAGTRWLQTDKLPYRDESGRITGVIGFAMDITERKQMDEALHARDVAEAASQFKSEFLANMSHELRTPLNGIIGFAEFLVDGKPGLINPKQKEYLNDILNSGRHLLQLINDVLDLAKVEAGKMELNVETFDLHKAIEEVCAVVKAIAQKKNIQVDTALASDLVQVTLDQHKFKQVLYNLLSNAVKFTDEGGHVEIITATRDAHHFKLVVKDTGIGIKPEDIERIFAEFEQLDSGASRRHAGTGLGLGLTRKLVELHGGSIDVESEPGRGSTFTLTLPMTAKEKVS